MYKYAVAHMDFFNNDLQMTIVEAENPIIGLIEGARQLMGAPPDDPWLNRFLEVNCPETDYGERLEEIKNEFFNTDNLVEVMPL